MPEKRTIQKARKDKRAGKAATTQAGEFVREEVHKIRRGRHGARSAGQAVAIGLSKARRAGVKLPRDLSGTGLRPPCRRRRGSWFGSPPSRAPGSSDAVRQGAGGRHPRPSRFRRP